MPIEKTARRKKSPLIPGVLLLLCAVIYFLYPDSGQREIGWNGKWVFYYFYENDSSLTYTGQMNLSEGDSLKVDISIKAPKSSRFQKPTITIISHKGNILQGQILHDQFKINGGHPKETFTWEISGNSFSGMGQCIAYCAEGTEGLAIKWFGQRAEENK